ncbi:hypothetical protein GCM10028805_36630 [Spirosoma harenae]
MIPKEHTYTKDNGNTYLTADFFNYLRLHDLIVDGSKGGLIIGPTKANGGVTLIGMNREAEVYIGSQAEGWCFLINAYAYHKEESVLIRKSQHSSLADTLFMPYPVPDHITLIDATQREIDGKLFTPFIIFDTDTIGTMPRVPAKANLDYLEKINQDAWTVRREWEKPEPTVNNQALEAKYGNAAITISFLGGSGSN